MASSFRALEEQPYLRVSKTYSDPLDKELDDYNTLTGLHRIGSDLNKNNPAAQALLLAYLNAFMGGKIIHRVSGPEYTAGPLQKILHEEFKKIDINKLYDINKIMEYIIVGSFVGGDILIHMPTDKERGDITTLVELIESNRISTPLDKSNDDSIRNGIKYSGGRITGYYVRPLESMYGYNYLRSIDYDFIPLYSKFMGGYRQNCMMFKSPLTDQYCTGRTYPALIACSKYLRWVQDYIEAVVIGGRVAACFAGFITSDNPAAQKEGFDTTNSALKHVGKIAPGGIYFLRRGENITFGSPSRPADNTDSLVKRLLILSSSSVRQPYELAFLHLENTSFSSWKGGTNEVEANRERWNISLNRAITFISYNIALECLIKKMVRGDIISLEFPTKFPKYDPLDSEKRARANKLNLANGTTSKQQICANENTDYDALIEEQLREDQDELIRKAKLVVGIKEEENSNNILFPSEESPTIREEELKRGESTNSGKKGTRETYRREGEEEELTEEDKQERRKEDGNV